jgi:hypothetical protein
MVLRTSKTSACLAKLVTIATAQSTVESFPRPAESASTELILGIANARLKSEYLITAIVATLRSITTN